MSVVQVGDRVIVSSQTAGTKTGTLRYVGPTEFAAGEWAGVELDAALVRGSSRIFLISLRSVSDTNLIGPGSYRYTENHTFLIKEKPGCDWFSNCQPIKKEVG